MAAKRPHILIDVDSQLAGRLWRALPEPERPFLFCSNPLASTLGFQTTPAGDSYRLGVSLERLIAHTLQNRPDPAVIAELEIGLGNVRAHFGLGGDARLTVALVGTQTSVSGNADGARMSSGNYFRLASRQPPEAAIRKGRTFVGLVDAALDSLDWFTPIWLADALPGLTLPLRVGPYAALAATARAHLATISIPPFDGSGRPLRRPAMPLLYVTEDPGPPDQVPWRLLRPTDRARAYSTTQALIAQFARWRSAHPTGRGTLVKLVPDLTDRRSGSDDQPDRQQNVLDAPMIGTKTLQEVDAAGIEAILLDARCGVVRETLEPALSRRLVYVC